MDGTSAINMLYQYPLWSLSQSAEITFVMFLFCWYKIWSFPSTCVLILLMYRTTCWPTCILVLFSVCFTEHICIAKIRLIVRKYVSMAYNMWIHAEFQMWLLKQVELMFRTHFLTLFKYVECRWNVQIWQFYNVITGMLKIL